MLYATAEVTPIAYSGGLGEVAVRLPLALRRAGHDVRVVMPWYGVIDDARWGIRLDRRVRFVYEGRSTTALVGSTELFGVPIYLVGHRVHTRQMYGGKKDKYGWVEEHLRFRFFCAATAAVFANSEWRPDVLHMNDYHNALIPLFMGDASPAKLLTIHNARFQGGGWTRETVWERLPRRRKDRDHSPLPPLTSPRARFVNFLRRGLRVADLIVAVSPTYARELAKPDHLDEIADVLPKRRLIGIANGIDTVANDPARDKYLARRYDATTLDHRAANKRALQRTLGVTVDANTPLLALIARLDPQKGIDLVLFRIVQLAERGLQIVITGNGGPRFRDLIVDMSKAAPGVLVYRPFVPEEESLYLGGADMMLMPSRYEPCGLVQLKALRYGAVPIVQRVGGLADTVIDHDSKHRRGTGFVFQRDTPGALLTAIDRALAVYRRPAEWRALQQRGMATDVGWERPAARYVDAYHRAMRIALADPKDRDKTH